MNKQSGFMKRSALALAMASEGNPIVSTVTVMLFYVMFNFLEASIEKLVFGDRFEHWLDPIFQLSFIAYAAYTVYACAIHNSSASAPDTQAERVK